MSKSNGLSKQTKHNISKYIRVTLSFVLIITMLSNMGVLLTKAASALEMPQNLNGDVSSSSVTLTWESVEGTTTYKIFRDGELLDETNETTYTDSFVDSGTEYRYSVIAIDNINHIQSEPAIVYLTTIIGTPEKFEAVNVSSQSLDLVWGAVKGATAYQIERDGVLLTEVTGLTFSDNSVQKDTTYLYKLYAIDGTTGQKSLSKELTVKTLLEAPNTPKNFQLYGNASPTNVVLNWDTVEDATKYTLKRNGEIIYEGSENAFKETETLPDGYTYTYELTASNSVGTSNHARLNVVIDSLKPKAPENLKTTKVTNTSISISFDEVDEADGYIVTIDGEDLETIKGTTYTFTGLEKDTIYTITVSSINEKGRSKVPSTLQVRTTLAPPEKVQNFKPTKITPSTVSLQWDELDSATEYEIYRDENELVYSGSSTSYQDSNVSPDTIYYYTVYGKNKNGTSEEGTTIKVTVPKETQPISITQPETTPYNVAFEFKVIEGVSTYKISRNPTWTYESNGDGTFDVNSLNSVTGEEKILGTVQVTDDGYLPFIENLNGSEGNNLTYNILGVIGTGENGELITTDPIEIKVNVPQPSNTPSNESTLSELTIKGGTLETTFDSNKTTYNVEIKDNVNQITLSPSLTENNATITVNGNPVSSGGTSQVISTSNLPKTVEIEVVAEDRITKTTYTLTLVKPSETEEPNNGDNGEVTEPTEPSNPDNGNDGEVTEPSNPSDENGTDEGETTNPDKNEGEEAKPTESSKNEDKGTDKETNNSNSNDESDSDKSDSKPSNVKDEGTNDSQSSGKEDSSSSDKESTKSDEQNKSNASKNELPDTANNFYNYMLIGLLLVVAGIVFLVVKRRKQAQ